MDLVMPRLDAHASMVDARIAAHLRVDADGHLAQRGGVRPHCHSPMLWIKQGCLASGALWAPLFDPMVRRLVAALPPHGYAVACFADDLAAALGKVVLGLRRLIPVLLEMLRGSRCMRTCQQ